MKRCRAPEPSYPLLGYASRSSALSCSGRQARGAIAPVCLTCLGGKIALRPSYCFERPGGRSAVFSRRSNMILIMVFTSHREYTKLRLSYQSKNSPRSSRKLVFRLGLCLVLLLPFGMSFSIGTSALRKAQ